MIDFDRFVFFGQTPTQWLQARLGRPRCGRWDVGFSLVYTSYFIVPFARRGRPLGPRPADFLRFARRLVTLALAALATYIAFPAAPPWMADQRGLLEGVHRTTSKGFNCWASRRPACSRRARRASTWLPPCPRCMPAFTALVAMFLWDGSPPPAAAAGPLPARDGLTLIATGEHYVFDVLLGWCYAGAVMAAWGWWERRSAAAASSAP